ncbi:helix-turn-helix transcriptional regulator [Streptomyces sasae]|uniref:helix-turn-helix transcriptional regulator n=1 Tax=Streptomyces sasae TaxID=1266772 RepID=UPI002931404E|nr:helix-turn-helix transcriptional regulator [Streptomyces sasae]
MSRCEHGVDELCPAGATLYERALRTGHITAEDAADTPCLTDFGLLHPALDDVTRLQPVTPAAALHRLLRAARSRVAAERHRENRLVDLFEPLTQINGEAAPDIAPLHLLSGTQQINRAISEALAEATTEVIGIQPRVGLVGPRGAAAQQIALARDQAFLDGGGRIRTLYQHSLRHVPSVYTYVEHLKGDSTGRSLDEVPDRLIVIDQTVAFVPADAEGTLALEVRHPALVKYLTTTFNRLWQLATPMFPKPERRPTVNGITPRQQAIAALLVEGHTDAVIADRLGMNIRTARDHIAKLAATLGSESRAQLGYLIGRSGILGQEG